MAPLVEDRLRHRKKWQTKGHSNTIWVTALSLVWTSHWRILKADTIWENLMSELSYLHYCAKSWKSANPSEKPYNQHEATVHCGAKVVGWQRVGLCLLYSIAPCRESHVYNYCHQPPQPWTSRQTAMAASAKSRGCQPDGWGLKKSIHWGNLQRKTGWEPDSPPLTMQDYPAFFLRASVLWDAEEEYWGNPQRNTCT